MHWDRANVLMGQPLPGFKSLPLRQLQFPSKTGGCVLCSIWSQTKTKNFPINLKNEIEIFSFVSDASPYPYYMAVWHITQWNIKLYTYATSYI